MDAKLNAIIESMHDEMIDTLQKWIRVPSVKGEAAPGAPFGKEVRSMLDMALADCEQMGFKTQNFDGYIAHADLGEGSDEDALAILAHLDVVPEGDGWQYPPYGAVIENGRVYGRGASDDKGPAVAALYAMKAVKDAGIPLRRKVRLILGCDEESGWEDIEHYNRVAVMPRMGFSPDASYPIINIEKGICRLELHGGLSREGLQVIAFNNGERPNVIPGRASALIAGDAATAALAEAAAGRLDIPAEVQLTDKGVSITVTGISGHAAYPETARNANGEMLLLLAVFLDLIFSVQAELFLNFQLYRQSVGIPACFSRYLIAFHSTVSRNHILDNTGLYVADVRFSVCGRRSVIEYVGRISFTHFHTFLEDLIVFPELLNLFFSLDKVHVG